MDRIKKWAVTALFFLMIFGFAAAWIIKPDEARSLSERRLLTQFQNIKTETLIKGGFGREAEKYLTDQFPLRGGFRSLKSLWAVNAWRLPENNGIYMFDKSLIKIENELREGQVLYAAKKIRDITQAHPESGGVYYAVIPGKSHYASGLWPRLDQARIEELLTETVENAQYIDISGLLSLEDYYRTDIHWRQESILPVARLLCETMGAKPPVDAFTQNSAGGFLGVLAGSWAAPVPADELVYLSSEVLKNARVSFYGQESEGEVYDLQALEGMEPYDMFLGGPQSLVVLENPSGNAGRELIIFRDSYSSSLAPLLLDSYDKISLVDLRYITTDMACEALDFTGADVLFLYSTAILNTGGILK